MTVEPEQKVELILVLKLSYCDLRHLGQRALPKIQASLFQAR